MSVVTELGDQMAILTPKDAKVLREYLQDKYGVESPDSGTPGPTVGVTVETVPEPTEFNVVYQGFGTSKINVIKVLREVTGLGLSEAKDLAEGPPRAIKEAVDKATAEDIKKRLDEAGAQVTIQPV